MAVADICLRYFFYLAPLEGSITLRSFIQDFPLTHDAWEELVEDQLRCGAILQKGTTHLKGKPGPHLKEQDACEANFSGLTLTTQTSLAITVTD